MANNYTQTSTFINIPPGKLDRAREICEALEEYLEWDDEDGYCGVSWEVQDQGVWLTGDESANIDHAEMLVRALVEELELNPVILSWADTCSRPRIDEFGGGAFLVQRGYPTFWVEPMATCMKEMLSRKDRTDHKPIGYVHPWDAREN